MCNSTHDHKDIQTTVRKKGTGTKGPPCWGYSLIQALSQQDHSHLVQPMLFHPYRIVSFKNFLCFRNPCLCIVFQNSTGKLLASWLSSLKKIFGLQCFCVTSPVNTPPPACYWGIKGAVDYLVVVNYIFKCCANSFTNH